MRVCVDLLTVSTTARVELVDLTDQVRAAVAEHRVREGVAHVWSLHTTAALLIARPESNLLAGLKRMLDPPSAPGGGWVHDSAGGGGPNDADRHSGPLLLGPSLSLQIGGGALILGEWQRLLLAELDGPRTRRLRVQVWGVG